MSSRGRGYCQIYHYIPGIYDDTTGVMSEIRALTGCSDIRVEGVTRLPAG